MFSKDYYEERLKYWYDNCEYMYVGLRFQDVPLVSGNVIEHNSHIWIDGDDTGEELPGCCVLSQGNESRAKGYEWFEHIAVVGYDDIVEYGEDIGEHIIRNPIVLEVLK